MKAKPEKNKKVLTLFLCLLPSVLIAMTNIIPSVPYRMVFQLLIFLMQYVIVKSLVDDFFAGRYEE
jgi:hypothetical protein